MEKPLISIVIPVYNVKQYLERCLNAVIGQTYKNLEIILVDDGSTDGSGQLCDIYEKLDTRIQVIHLELNRGVSHARNVGSDRATGSYIGFLDSDDYIESNMYERLYESLEESKAEVSVCGVQRIGFGEYEHFREEPSQYVISGEQAIPYMLCRWPCGWAVNNKLLASYLVKKYSFNERIHCGEDILFFYRLFMHVERVSYTPERLYHYIYRKNSAMNDIFNIRQYTEFQAYEILYRDILKHYPELASMIEQKILVINNRLAVSAIESEEIKGKRLYYYLHKFRRNIRQYMNKESLSCIEYKKLAAEIILLYTSAELYWIIVIIYKKLRGILR